VAPAPRRVNDGLCTSSGDTCDEVLANIREAIELYVEALREASEPVPTKAGEEFVEVEAA
jgi:predicted RNase H-like HicB family nuclease